MDNSAPGPFDNELFTTQEAARLIRLSIPTLERHRSAGTGPAFIRLGPGKRAKIAYRRADLEAWLAENTFRSTSEYKNKER